MTRDRQIDLALWAAIIFGGILRFLPAVLTAFPVNDGGMLLAMTRDLGAAGFLLPAFTSYNYSNIPFAYPPLGMYVARLLSSAFSISELELFRWLPPLVSTAIIPAFYWLARQILNSRTKAVIAALLYALMPGSSDWLIMGGGLTRSFGILFALFAAGFAYRLFRGDDRNSIVALTILFCTLAVLSHPEVALQTAAICFVIWAYHGRTLSAAKNAGLVVLGTTVLTSPWWLTVLRHHGFSPFWSAINTGIHETMLASFFHAFFSIQGGIPLVPVLSLLGIFVVLRRREFLLPLLIVFPFIVDPRNAPAISIFPILMLAGEGLDTLNSQFIRAYSESFPTQRTASQYLPILTLSSLGLILLYLFGTSYLATSTLVRISLSASDRETMQWISENTPPESRFLLLTNTGTISPMTDAYQEWFPVLAERQSVNTLQGMEWLIGPQFFRYSQELVSLQACPDADCLRQWSKQNDIQVDFILAHKKRATPALIDSLRADEDLHRVYESESAEVFAVLP